MTQWGYQTIASILQSGAPALANSLMNELNSLIQENDNLKAELAKKSEKPEKKVDKSEK